MKVKSRVVPERHIRKGEKRRWNWKVYVGRNLAREGVEPTYPKASVKAKKVRKILEKRERKK